MSKFNRIPKLLIPLIIAILVALASLWFAFDARYSEVCHRMFTDAEYTVHVNTEDAQYTIIIEQDHDLHGERCICFYYKASTGARTLIGRIGPSESNGFNLENGKFYIEYDENSMTFFYCEGDVTNKDNWKFMTLEYPD